MIRVPIDEKKKIKSINIGNKKELANLFGDWITKELEIVSPKTKVIATEYADGQIIFSIAV